MDQTLYNLLVASFDRDLSDEEQTALNQGLERSEDLRREKIALQNLRKLTAAQSPEFAPFFAGRVMHKIDTLQTQPKEPALAKWLTKMFPKVALSGMAVIVLLIINTYFMEGSFSLDTLLGISEVAAEDADYFLMENF
ncbi:hypothetical protein [Microscilla marina]|uniref:Uncharacterized protein n=1 Tax=Microscilla marina ATCC 23134 TaxID=313606 RepID=A1ZJG5_MICM2|nr:hypothetical protein [Microscilla marina]EAY29268.1 hypothetical protein M23134_01322 [Microscilla marina ATCC 23134]